MYLVDFMGSNLSRMTELVTVCHFCKLVGTEPERPRPLHLSSMLLLTDEETQLLSGKATDQRFLVHVVEPYAYERSFVLLRETTKSRTDANRSVSVEISTSTTPTEGQGLQTKK